MLNSLTAEQKNILQTINQGLGLASDMSKAVVTVYLMSSDKKYLYVYRQVHPLTVATEKVTDLSNKKLRSVEEPLVYRALTQNVIVSGKRERTLGSFNSFYAYPLRDIFGKCFGVISFDTCYTNQIMLHEAMELLKNISNNGHYPRLSPDDGVLIVDKNKVIIAANTKAQHIMQVLNVDNIVGRRTNELAINWPLIGMVIDTGICESKQFMMHGRMLYMKVLPVISKPKSGCAVVILQDITEIHKKDEELLIKSLVIKEIHHRVKNNLQTIVSLLRLQERRSQNTEVKSVLKDCIGRVNSIAVVHECLSKQDVEQIEIEKVIKSIYQAVTSSMLSADFSLKTDVSVDDILMPSTKATSIALIFNELLQNTIEHAFANKNNGKIKIRLTVTGNCYNLLMVDDGNGLPNDFDTKKENLGLKIIRTMVEADLHGSFSINNNVEGGVTASIVIPKDGGE